MRILSEYTKQLLYYNRLFSELRFHPERTFKVSMRPFFDLGENFIEEIGQLILKSIGNNSRIVERYAIESFQICYRCEIEFFDLFQSLTKKIYDNKYDSRIGLNLAEFLEEIRETLIFVNEDVTSKLYSLILDYFPEENTIEGKIRYIKQNPPLFDFANKTHFKEKYPKLGWQSDYPLNSKLSFKKKTSNFEFTPAQLWLIQYFKTDSLKIVGDRKPHFEKIAKDRGGHWTIYRDGYNRAENIKDLNPNNYKDIRYFKTSSMKDLNYILEYFIEKEQYDIVKKIEELKNKIDSLY